MKDVLLVLIGYGGYLVVPAYFVATPRGQRQLSRLMLGALVIQVVGTLAVGLVAKYLAAHGGKDALFTWYLIFPLNGLVLAFIGCGVGWRKLRDRVPNA